MRSCPPAYRSGVLNGTRYQRSDAGCGNRPVARCEVQPDAHTDQLCTKIESSRADAWHQRLDLHGVLPRDKPHPKPRSQVPLNTATSLMAVMTTLASNRPVARIVCNHRHNSSCRASASIYSSTCVSPLRQMQELIVQVRQQLTSSSDRFHRLPESPVRDVATRPCLARRQCRTVTGTHEAG